MQKTKTKILTALLLTAMTLALFPMAANASLGNILINVTTGNGPSIVGQPVAAGGTVMLNFSQTTWSGGVFYLLMSRDGFSAQSTGDFAYSPTFDVANLTATGSYISNYTVAGKTWRLVNNTVTGPIASNIAGGNYYIKAFDGSVTAVAVTDTYLTVYGQFSVLPTSGTASRAITLSGSGFPANAAVNLTYSVGGPRVNIAMVTTDANGVFSYATTAPDLRVAVLVGENVITAAGTITFYANDTSVERTATYTEYPRGLVRAGGNTAASGSAYGNLTVFAALVGVSSAYNLTGVYFPPGAVGILFDNSIDIAPATGVTANATGFFTTSVTIPITTLGSHNITMTDANGQKFIIFISIGTTLVLTPTSGPVGTVVTANGYGFPAATSSNSYNVTLSWAGYSTVTLGFVMTTSGGQFQTTFVAPHDYKGVHTVTATANDSSATAASKTFTITSLLIVSPNTLSNAGTPVSAICTGFDPADRYILNIDNQQFALDPSSNNWQTDVVANGTGDLTMTFIDAGFQAGTHVFAMYKWGTTTVTYYALFTVTGTDANTAILNQINQTTTSTGTVVNSTATKVNSIKETVEANNVLLVAINGTVVTIKTNVATVQTTLTAIDAKLTSISGSIATLTTNVGSVSTTVSQISASISSISNGVASIQSTVGSFSTQLSNLNAAIVSVNGSVATLSTSVGVVLTTLDDINAVVTRIDGNVATIQTAVGTLQGTVTSISNDVATIKTGVGTLQTDVSTIQPEVTTAKDNTSNMSTLIYVAVAFALIAAIAAVASILLMRKKIAS